MTNTVNDAPDRLWLSAPDADQEHEIWFEPGEGGTEYIRADRTQATTLVDAAWDELCEKDDRTSPEHYPDMCLITKDELAGLILLNLQPVAGALALAALKLAEEYMAGFEDDDLQAGINRKLAIMRAVIANLEAKP